MVIAAQSGHVLDYLNMGETILAVPSKSLALTSLDDLCRLQLALPRGSATTREASRSAVSA